MAAAAWALAEPDILADDVKLGVRPGGANHCKGAQHDIETLLGNEPAHEDNVGRIAGGRRRWRGWEFDSEIMGACPLWQETAGKQSLAQKVGYGKQCCGMAGQSSPLQAIELVID
jgi:hypothetical protein